MLEFLYGIEPRLHGWMRHRRPVSLSDQERSGADDLVQFWRGEEIHGRNRSLYEWEDRGALEADGRAAAGERRRPWHDLQGIRRPLGDERPPTQPRLEPGAVVSAGRCRRHTPPPAGDTHGTNQVAPDKNLMKIPSSMVMFCTATPVTRQACSRRRPSYWASSSRATASSRCALKSPGRIPCQRARGISSVWTV